MICIRGSWGRKTAEGALVCYGHAFPSSLLALPCGRRMGGGRIVLQFCFTLLLFGGFFLSTRKGVIKGRLNFAVSDKSQISQSASGRQWEPRPGATAPRSAAAAAARPGPGTALGSAQVGQRYPPGKGRRGRAPGSPRPLRNSRKINFKKN